MTGTLIADKLEELYKLGKRDEDIEPIVAYLGGKPFGRIEDGDTVIFCCRRGEREIQLTEAFVMEDFEKFRVKRFKDLEFVTLVKYDERFKNVKVAFDFPPLKNTLSEVISQNDLKQLHMAESEKYAHVTFFFNGRRRTPFPNETDVLVESPSFEDLSKIPELSIYELVEVLTTEIKRKEYDFILVNFANADVIGHLPDMEPKVECVKHLSKALERAVKTALSNDYAVLITADHGLIELGMKSLNPPVPNLGHTTNPVPFFLILPDDKIAFKKSGRISNVAPTVLKLMGLEKPDEMIESLLLEKPTRSYRVILIIMDGWGIGPKDERNPIYIAKPKFWCELIEKYEHGELSASGEDVGLLKGRPGNSEAGHMNLGAGRVVIQDEVIIERSLKEGTFAERKVFVEAFKRVLRKNKKLHLISMLSTKSSHGTIDYPIALVEKAKSMGIKDIFIHVIFNRHGVENMKASELLRILSEKVERYEGVYIVTGVGRKWALDRDKRYDRTKIAYNALVYGKGIKVSVDRNSSR
ncbi:alkaline phosphatase family protein [Thermotoga sp. KOL6]|uniref:alkaline phosphatase family protein n=1 Tax=Thermotoga sp. KOL6 TaxID=126741 RepID=UPI000C768F96|nr:alkaline phosphatase family protein [Thermotoga sp. KOL6]PLV59764.1 hypothetical protein AS005_00225 [Thermotoga sp. KOL6]